jgi:raffinose/stachyose/melibiose transport system substrate-binding protein
MRRTFKAAIGVEAAALALFAGLASAQAGSLKIESWRNDDADIWNSKIIPAFNKHYPDIKVEFAPSAPKEYNAALNARLDGGTAGDLITCRPFDASLALYQKRQLDPVDGIKGMDNFSDVAKAAWQTDDGKSTFCVPIASVIAGFIYNKEAFAKVGVSEPKTLDEFHAILEKLKKDGTYVPLVMGTADQWEAATMGFQNVGPDYWKGETGRANLIAGKEKLNISQRSRRSRAGRHISDPASRRRPTPTVRTCSRSARARSMRPARGISRRSAARRNSPWGPSRRRCRLARRIAISPITPTSRWASTRPRRTRKTRRNFWNG